MNVINEGLRYQSPGGITPIVFEKDTNLAGKITMKKGDCVRLVHWALHKNPDEWQRPEEFLPDRWDPESPLYLTPKGKKRNTLSFMPWNAGKRVCFGKVFAENNLKIILTYFTQWFNFEFAEKNPYPGNTFPVCCMNQSRTPPIMVRITHRKQQN